MSYPDFMGILLRMEKADMARQISKSVVNGVSKCSSKVTEESVQIWHTYKRQRISSCGLSNDKILEGKLSLIRRRREQREKEIKLVGVLYGSKFLVNGI